MSRREYMREYQKKWYKRNSEKVKAQSDGYREDIKKWFRELVSKLSCVKCGENHPGCLDFHHKDPASKDDAVANLVMHKRKKETILKEIEKCEVLCANCHRKLHYEERGTVVKVAKLPSKQRVRVRVSRAAPV